MANYCGNDISFIGPSAQLTEIKQLLSNGASDFDFNQVSPVSDNHEDYQEAIEASAKAREVLTRDPEALRAAWNVYMLDTPLGREQFPDQNLESQLAILRQALTQDLADLPTAVEDSEERREMMYSLPAIRLCLVIVGLLAPASQIEAAKQAWGASPAYQRSEEAQFIIKEKLPAGKEGRLQYYLSTVYEEPGRLIETLASRFPTVQMVLISSYEGELRVRIASFKADETTVEFDDDYDEKTVDQICQRYGIVAIGLPDDDEDDDEDS
jgi:hypothetical protein